MTGKKTLRRKLTTRLGIVALLVAIPTAYYGTPELLPDDFMQWPGTQQWVLSDK